MKKEFTKMLYDERDTPLGWAVIMAMIGMVENDDRFHQLAEFHKGMQEYHNFMTEKEARKVVDSFVNYDGSRGPKWTIDTIQEELRKFGGMIEERGHYNKWMMYVLINGIYSDYGGVIMKMTDGKDFVKNIYLMALAMLDDKDRRESVREYYMED